MNLNFENIPFLTFIWENITIESVLKFAVAYFFIIWIAIIIWVIKDVSNRTNNIFLQIISLLIVIFLTPFWVFLYLLIRPGRTIFEKYYEDVEENLNILSRIIEQREEQQKENELTDCPNCNYEIQKDFIICPNCKKSLKSQCIECKKEIHDNWKVCPYCTTKQKRKKSKKN